MACPWPVWECVLCRFSLAQHCAGLGMRVVAGCYLMGEGAARLAQVDNISTVRVDVTDEASVREAVGAVAREVELAQAGLHCLVNNAAAGVVFAEAAWQTSQQVELEQLLSVCLLFAVDRCTPSCWSTLPALCW